MYVWEGMYFRFKFTFTFIYLLNALALQLILKWFIVLNKYTQLYTENDGPHGRVDDDHVNWYKLCWWTLGSNYDVTHKFREIFQPFSRNPQRTYFLTTILWLLPLIQKICKNFYVKKLKKTKIKKWQCRKVKHNFI